MNDNETIRRRKIFEGVLLGTAGGDALGLPAEKLSRDRIQRQWHGQWRHRFIFGRGMWSDDTEHTLLVAQALLTHPSDPFAFQRCLAWKLRWWLLGLPAGIGLGTLRAILKLWIGFPPAKSGVYSPGNAPAMRSAILGVFFADDPIKRREFVVAATQLTHTDPRAETAALAVAESAAWITRQSEPIEAFLQRLPLLAQDREWHSLCRTLLAALAQQSPVDDFARSIGLHNAVSGYAYHTVPVALYAWLRHAHEFPTALKSALNCGGDTDTVGAIVGALAGASCGARNIPADWIDGLWEWPRSCAFIRRIAVRLSEQRVSQEPLGPIRYFWPGLVPRNLLFLVVVLAHGIMRMVPRL